MRARDLKDFINVGSKQDALERTLFNTINKVAGENAPELDVMEPFKTMFEERLKGEI